MSILPEEDRASIRKAYCGSARRKSHFASETPPLSGGGVARFRNKSRDSGSERLAGEQLPVAAALLPDEQEPDLDRRRLAAALADPGHVDAHERQIAHQLRRHLGELD